MFNPLNAELNPICHLLALLGAHHVLHVSKIGVKGKIINITHYVCVFVALGIQNAMGVGHIVNCDLPSSTIFYSTLSHKQHDFGKEKLLNIIRMWPLFLSNFSETRIFSTDFRKIL